MAGRVPFSSGAVQNQVFIDLTDESEPVESTVSNVAVHINLPRTSCPRSLPFPCFFVFRYPILHHIKCLGFPQPFVFSFNLGVI